MTLKTYISNTKSENKKLLKRRGSLKGKKKGKKSLEWDVDVFFPIPSKYVPIPPRYGQGQF